MSSSSSYHSSATGISLLHFLRNVKLLPIEQISIIRRSIPTLLLSPSPYDDSARQAIFLSVDDICDDFGRGMLDISIQITGVSMSLLPATAVERLSHYRLLAYHEVKDTAVV